MYHAYGEITDYSGPLTACDINHFVSCVTVFTSGYTTFLGVSLWVYGIVWFPLILFSGYWMTKRSDGIRWEVMVPLLMVGNVFTLYLWYLELVKIHAICPVCVSLYTLNYVMTGIAAYSAWREN
jgi:uncharacterized membrane protein